MTTEYLSLGIGCITLFVTAIVWLVRLEGQVRSTREKLETCIISLKLQFEEAKKSFMNRCQGLEDRIKSLEDNLLNLYKER